MKTLRKINENNFIIYHIQTDLGLIIKVKTDASLSEYQTNNLLQSVSKKWTISLDKILNDFDNDIKQQC